MRRLLLPLLLLFPIDFATAKDQKPAKKNAVTREKPDANAMAYADRYHWADWVEPDFPFFSSVLDARDVGPGFPNDNLTPRGLILNLGHNLWACFDTDLLRIACIWQGEEGKPPVTPNALAPGSYHVAGQKTKDGEDDLPTPVGKVWLANGLYPGWQVLKSPDDKPSFVDPREPAPDKEEVGRGPVDEKVGKFKSARITPSGCQLEYEVTGVQVTELIETPKISGEMIIVKREFAISPSDKVLAMTCCQFGEEMDERMAKLSEKDRKLLQMEMGPTDLAGIHANNVHLMGYWDKHRFLVIEPRAAETRFALVHACLKSNCATTLERAESPAESRGFSAHWPQTVTTKATLSQKDDAYLVDDIPLPLDNPWKRNVRLADLAFIDDQGNAAAVTMDGDVWMISGLNGDLGEVKWKRFASGLHEPMSIVARPGPQASGSKPQADLFVFDRNGIWRLRDTNRDGECDVHEMFCNRFAQTAETREFPNSMKLAPDGSFIISKGGQQGTHLGKHNGTVIRVSPDGRKFDVIGWGLRQPFVGVHPKTGLVTASDQEGNYVPTTPLHIIKDHRFYGHLATIQPHEQYPQTIADPLTWIPHAVVASAVTQTWLTDAKMGPVNDELILISFNKAELHRVVGRICFPSTSHGDQSRPAAAVIPWIKNLDFPTLNAHVNPADGQLYAVGFQIWGASVKRISGLARIRYTGKPRILLQECTPCDKGVLLRFNLPLDKAAATNPDNYNIERWNYKRTFNYGSPHLKADGTPGQEWMVPSSAYLSKDGTSVFVGLPDMKTTYMQMRVGYGLKGAEGLPAQNNAYFTPYELMKFEPEKAGFDRIDVDLTPRKMVAATQAKPTLEEGRRLYEMMGCIACHSTDGTLYGKVGPSWKGLFGTERILAKGGGRCIADDAYLKESIQNPPAKVVKGFEKLDAGMPVYAGVLNDSQIDSLILFIKSLK